MTKARNATSIYSAPTTRPPPPRNTTISPPPAKTPVYTPPASPRNTTILPSPAKTPVYTLPVPPRSTTVVSPPSGKPIVNSSVAGLHASSGSPAGPGKTSNPTAQALVPSGAPQPGVQSVGVAPSAEIPVTGISNAPVTPTQKVTLSTSVEIGPTVTPQSYVTGGATKLAFSGLIPGLVIVFSFF